jgi:L-fuconolactonase
MPIIDSQIHPYEANTAKRPWQSTPNWPPSATADENIAAMNKLGIDGAILISAFSMYRYDASYAVEAHKAHPDRFALVKPVDPDDPAVADVIAEWRKHRGRLAFGYRSRKNRAATGIRIIPASSASRGQPPAMISP